MGFLGQLLCSIWIMVLKYPFTWRKKRDGRQFSDGNEEIMTFLNKGSVIHRGGVPENTIKAFREAKLTGASCIEVDLQFTKDGHPVLLHDDTVDRTSDGTGFISSLTLQEVKALDVGVKYGHSGVGIPTLSETIEAIKELDLFMFLEVKASNSATIPTILKIFSEDSSLYERVAVISFFPDVIHKISQVDPKIKIGYTTRFTVLSSLPTGEPRFKSFLITKLASVVEGLMSWFISSLVLTTLKPNLLLPHKNDILLKRFDIEKYRKEGIIILTWTVNDEYEQQHLRDTLKVAFMTDRLDSC